MKCHILYLVGETGSSGPTVSETQRLHNSLLVDNLTRSSLYNIMLVTMSLVGQHTGEAESVGGAYSEQLWRWFRRGVFVPSD